nr:DUF6790 family protein [Nitrobacter vulgaris]
MGAHNPCFLPGYRRGTNRMAGEPLSVRIGMADLAIGITAILSFWRELAFKAAAVCAASVFLLGDAVGHVRQMVIVGNFAPGNAGLPFYMDIVCPLLAIALVFVSKANANKRKRLPLNLP